MGEPVVGELVVGPLVVGALVGPTVGALVMGALVGDLVGTEGAAVGALVGAFVGNLVGAPVGAPVVGAPVTGAPVGAAVVGALVPQLSEIAKFAPVREYSWSVPVAQVAALLTSRTRSRLRAAVSFNSKFEAAVALTAMVLMLEESWYDPSKNT